MNFCSIPSNIIFLDVKVSFFIYSTFIWDRFLIQFGTRKIKQPAESIIILNSTILIQEIHAKSIKTQHKKHIIPFIFASGQISVVSPVFTHSFEYYAAYS